MKFLLVLCLASISQAQKPNVRHLNMKMNRLTRIIDVLQKDVSDIWTVIYTSGIENLEFVNKTRADSDNFNEKEECVNEQKYRTVNDVKELKTEVEELILYSRKGFKNEKAFQREALSNLNQSYLEFQTSMTKENGKIRQQVERLDLQVALLQETSKHNQLQIEAIDHEINTSINERDAQSVLLETMKSMLDNFSEKLTRLEIENQESKQKIDNLNAKQSKLETENQELKRNISEMQGKLPELQSTMSCENNWTLFNNHCYHYITNPQSSDNALKTCKSKDSYLVEITSDSEMEFVAGLSQGSFLVWIGATDAEQGYEGTYVYRDSKSPVPEKLWGDGQPRNLVSSMTNCVVMYMKDSHAELQSCPCGWFKLYFVCEKPTQ